MSTITVTLVRKPGCHLCDDADAVVHGVVEELRRTGGRILFETRSILDDPALDARYRDDIPVVLVDGVQHARWRVDPALLRRALASGV